MSVCPKLFGVDVAGGAPCGFVAETAIAATESACHGGVVGVEKVA